MKAIKSETTAESKHTASNAVILKKMLADGLLLQIKSKLYHWDVTGPEFTTLQAFFLNQYTEMEALNDKIAARIRFLGHSTIDTMNEFIDHLKKEHKTDGIGEYEMLGDLLKSHEEIISDLRNLTDSTTNIDKVSSDFFTDHMRQHEKMAWLIRSHQSNLGK